jgi:hypothetical protein
LFPGIGDLSQSPPSSIIIYKNDLKLDVGVGITIRPATGCSDRFIDDDGLDLELKIS